MKRLALLGTLVLLVMAIAVPASAKQHKTWVCHETHSSTNQWILVHVASGWDAGHGNGRAALHQNTDNALDVENTPDGFKLKAGPIDSELIDGETCKFIAEEEVPEVD
jgi:hypothetical protein